MNLITLDGRPLDSFGLLPRPGHQHAMLPTTVERRLAVPGRHGSYDFGASLTERLFLFPLVYAKELNRFELQQKMREFSAFMLDGFGYPRDIVLEITYDPGVYYTVRFSGGIVPERVYALGYFDLTLIASDPFARSMTESDGIILDSDIVLDSSIRLDDGFSYTVNAPMSLEINNWGTMNVYPEIVIDGDFTTLTITANGKTFEYNQPLMDEHLVIKGESMTIKRGEANGLPGMSGNFIFLKPGVNIVSIDGTGLSCTVSFNFKTKYA